MSPLNQKSLKVDKSLPELPVYNGDNVIVRNNVPVADQRLSRKHITLSTSSSANCSTGFVVGHLHSYISFMFNCSCILRRLLVLVVSR